MNVGRAVARRFAETMLFWRGGLKAGDVQRFARVSERTARNLISEWRVRGLLPPYKPSSERCLVPDERFEPAPEVIDPGVAFALMLIGNGLPGNPFASTVPKARGHDLSLTAATPSAAVREFVAAWLDREPVRLVYAAKTGRQEFVFSPSELVRTRGRYHVRGYRAGCRDEFSRPLEDRYVDVVPARSIDAWRDDEAPFVGLDGDDDWNSFERREFILSKELSHDERLCYEHEYGIPETGKRVIRVRRALMPYLLQELAERRCWRRDGSSAPVWDTKHALETS